MLHQESDGDYNFIEPHIEIEDDKKIVKMVWDRYRNYTDSQLVTLTHRKGTPWGVCFKEGENCEIPDSYTELYYKKLVKIIVENGRRS